MFAEEIGSFSFFCAVGDKEFGDLIQFLFDRFPEDFSKYPIVFHKALDSTGNFCHFLGFMLKHLSNKIREKVLAGKWPAETAAESQMLKDFRASKMSVKKFLKEKWN